MTALEECKLCDYIAGPCLPRENLPECNDCDPEWSKRASGGVARNTPSSPHRIRSVLLWMCSLTHLLPRGLCVLSHMTGCAVGAPFSPVAGEETALMSPG